MAVELATKLACEIISADSRQIYKELNIGVAKPEGGQLTQVIHHFIGNVSIHDHYDVAMYEAQVLDLTRKLFVKYDHAVLVGGTGMYIDAIINGLDAMPANDEQIAKDLEATWKENGYQVLCDELQVLDPEYFDQVDKNNPVRVLRALNVIRQSKQTFTSFRKLEKPRRDFETKHFYVDVDREVLYERIDHRVDKMIAEGLEIEAKSLLAFKTHKSLNTVGYKEWWGYFEGTETLEGVIEKIKQHSRNYAKRQVTWFKKRETIPIKFSKETHEMVDQILKSILLTQNTAS